MRCRLLLLGLVLVACGDDAGFPAERTDATGDVVALTDGLPEGRQVRAPQVDLERVRVERSDGRVRIDATFRAPLREEAQLTVSFEGADGVVASATSEDDAAALFDRNGKPLGRGSLTRSGARVLLDLPGEALDAATSWNVLVIDQTSGAVDAVPDFDESGHPEITVIR